MNLAEPFNTIFKNHEEAEWAFDFFAETIRKLGLRDLNDKRFALTVRYNNSILRLNFGNWMVLDMSQEMVDIALIDNEVKQLGVPFTKWGAFATRDKTERVVTVHVLPLKTVRNWSGNLRDVYERSVQLIAERFKNWKGSPFRHAHQAEIFEAFFDLEKRQKILGRGTTTVGSANLEGKIRNQLVKAGWNDDGIVQGEQIGGHFVDFVLLHNLYPLAVVEVKASDSYLLAAAEEVRSHASDLVPFALATNGSEVVLMNTADGQLRKQGNLPSPKELWQARGESWSDTDPRLFTPFEARHTKLFQAHAVSKVLDRIVSGGQHILLHMATGLGRQHVGFELSWKLLKSGYFKKAMIVASPQVTVELLSALYQPFGDSLNIASHFDALDREYQVQIISEDSLVKGLDENDRDTVLDWCDLILVEDYHPSFPWEKLIRQFPQSCLVAMTRTRPATIRTADLFEGFIASYSFEDYLRSEIFEPPTGFYKVTLGDIAQIVTGMPTTPKEQTESPPEGGTSWPRLKINTKDVDPFDEGGLVTSSYHFFENQEAFAESITLYGLEPNDILVPRNYSASTRIRVGIVSDDFPGGVVFSHALFRIRVNKGIADPDDVFTYLRSSRGQQVLKQLSSGSSVAHIPIESLRQLPIFLPETEEVSKDAQEELSAIRQTISTLRDDILPMLEQEEINGESRHNTANLENVAKQLQKLASILVPLSLEERVITEFPTPIALVYQRFLNSKFNVFEQVMRLKDVYESTCFYIYNVLLASVLHHEQPFFIQEKGSRQAFKSDSMASRMQFVKAVQDIVKEQNKNSLFLPELVDSFNVEVTDQLRQELRNRAAHTATSPENHQKKILDEFLPIVNNLLEELDYLRKYPLVRIPLFYFEKGKLMRRMEVYTGTSPKLEEQPFSLEPETIQADRNNLVLINEDNEVLDLHPFYQLVSSERTHFETHLCFLKQRRGQNQVLLGESIQGAFEVELEGFDDFEKLQARLPQQSIE
jgi:hypothetical protein